MNTHTHVNTALDCKIHPSLGIISKDGKTSFVYTSVYNCITWIKVIFKMLTLVSQLGNIELAYTSDKNMFKSKANASTQIYDARTTTSKNAIC